MLNKVKSVAGLIHVDILCHASGICQKSKEAYDHMLTEKKDASMIHMSYRMDTSSYNGENMIIKCLTTYNMKKFNFFYDKMNIDKYEVPTYFEFNVTKPKTNYMKIFKMGGLDLEKSFCKLLENTVPNSISVLTFTLYYNSDCQHLNQYIGTWKSICEKIREYNYGSIKPKEKVNFKFTIDTELPLLEMKEHIYEIKT
jgi:hypothetical protein